jgi:hypothetical protein
MESHKTPGSAPVGGSIKSNITARSSSASTRWRLEGKLPDGHAPVAAYSTPLSRGAELHAAAAARDLVAAAQHEDVSARLRALRCTSSSNASAAPDSARHTSGGSHAAWRPSPLGSARPSPLGAAPLGSPRRYGVATAAWAGTTTMTGAAGALADDRDAAAADRHLKILFEPGGPSQAPPAIVASNYFVRPTTGALGTGRGAETEAGEETRSKGMPRGALAEAALRELLHEVQSAGTHVDKVMALNKRANRIATLLES